MSMSETASLLSSSGGWQVLQAAREAGAQDCSLLDYLCSAHQSLATLLAASTELAGELGMDAREAAAQARACLVERQQGQCSQ